jgi:hypothetical protein
MMKENLVNQIDKFLNVLPLIVKKHQDSSNSALIQFFRREYETAYCVQNAVKHQLQDLKKYCESGAGYTNDMQMLKENILKGTLDLSLFKVPFPNVGKVSLRIPSHLR